MYFSYTLNRGLIDCKFYAVFILFWKVGLFSPIRFYMYFSFTTIRYYMQMSNRQIRSREFIVGIDEVVHLTTADNSDLSDGDDSIDEEDIVFLEEATPEIGSENEVLVTIDDARADTQIPIDSSPLDYIFSWEKITSGSNTVDIPVCTLPGAVN